jgi:phthiocerol/phenolphthiocerol synthesis type-I polyketide synthase E
VVDVVDDLDPVAIIGMAGRFPGASSVDELWANLRDGKEGIAHFSDEELVESGVDPALLGRDNYVRAKGVLAEADRFDAAFFGYSPREAEIMDPQQRVFLECAWQALEAAGYDPREFRGRIGVFAGASLNSYLLFNLAGNRRAVDSAGSYQTLIANDKDFLATRVSYKLDLKGPSVTVQTACSTSLTAVHLACQSLLNGECDVALAGGVSVSVPLVSGYLYERGGILAPDGHCRAFDAAAGGTVAGNGVGVVVLRRLAQARAHGDAVEAVIRGTAINNDGSLKVGYTAPSVDGQAEVIAEAWDVAGVDPATAGYIETHGTGTMLGDPIEVAALTKAFREHTSETGFCAIGSVKSSVGHLDAAAGVTALITATLALRHEAIPPTLNHTTANPELALATSPFYVNTLLRPWPRTEAPRRAGVSSFGIGGSNAHVVLEEAPAVAERPASSPVRLFALSARTAPALAEAGTRLAAHLRANPEVDLGDVAYTLATRRRAFECRRAVVGQDWGDALVALSRVTAADAVTAPGADAPVAFLFPGQGSQYVDMARDLYDHERVFAEELDRCAELFAERFGTDVRVPLFAWPEEARDAARTLEQTATTQPVLFAVEYALARLLESWGVRPRAMAGHSIGEYVAACLAGVFSLPDAVRLVAARGRLVQSMPTGAMLAVFLSEPDLEPWLAGTPGLSLAAVNSTALSVVSGPVDAIEELRQQLGQVGIGCRRLHTSHAFHSPSMDGAVEPFLVEVSGVTLHPPRIPFCSNVTGTWITDEQATSPRYWADHLRQPVRFDGALARLLDDPALVLVEVGPGQTLSAFARQHVAFSPGRTVVGCLRQPTEKRDDREYLLRSLGMLWESGVPVDWAALYAGEEPRAVRLPGYAFQRERYWIRPDGTDPVAGGAADPAGSAPVADRFFTPGWRRLAPAMGAVQPDPTARWVVLGADLALGADLVRRLRADGSPVVEVRAGAELSHDGDSWTLDPVRREHYADLLAASAGTAPAGTAPGTLRVVHGWSLDGGPDAARPDLARRLEPAWLDAGRRGFDSLLALAQGIGDARLDGATSIDVLCRGVYDVTGDDALQPENAILLGLTTVMPQELAGVACRALDLTGLDPHRPGDGPAGIVYRRLRESTVDNELALRGRHWWARDFDQVRLDAPAPGAAGIGRVRDGGVYLITGGLGGVGLALAEYLADAAHAPVLALLTRSPFPDDADWARWLAGHPDGDATSARIQRLQGLARRGARVVVLHTDVTDLDQTRRAVAELRTRFGPVTGVIHAAGVPSRGLLANTSRADVDAVLAAKTAGTLVLDEVCADDPLDLVVLCSSLTAVLGGPGQSAYAGANAFLDAYAQWKRRTSGVAVTAVAWDTWRGVGMAAGLAARLGGGSGAADVVEDGGGHPLLGRLVQRTGQGRTYATTLSTARHWFIDEHRIQGHGLVPGTTYLELVRAAVAEEAGGRVIELHDVLFTMPVIVPDGQTREIFTTVEKADEGQVRFAVRSRLGGAAGAAWQEHASGTVTFADPDPGTVRDLDEVRRECGVADVIDTEDELKRRLRLDAVERGGQIEFTFGPRWRCVRQILAGERGLLVTLELDEAYHGDLDGYALHPALLDVAGAAARIRARDVYYLPFTYRGVRIAGPLTSTIHCHVRLKGGEDTSGETYTCDLDILDPTGRVLVQITDFTIKRINDLDVLVEQIDRAAAAPDEPSVHSGASMVHNGALSLLAEGMTEQDAVDAFARVLAAPELPERVVVSAKDLGAMRRLARSITPASLAKEIELIAPLGGTHPRPDLATPYVEPATEEERAVAAIWQQVLGVDRVGVHDDFFALGGHSLAAVQIGAKIQSQFRVQLDLRDFFDGPTVANTVTVVASAGRAAGRGADVIPVLDRSGPTDDADDLDADLANLDTLSDDEVEARLRELFAS